MELKDLSSNWKKLQKTLQPTSRPPKRKASEDILQPQRNGAKRRKAEGNGASAAKTGKRDREGMNMEEETVTAPADPATNDKFNEGLSPTYVPLADSLDILGSFRAIRS